MFCSGSFSAARCFLPLGKASLVSLHRGFGIGGKVKGYALGGIGKLPQLLDDGTIFGMLLQD